MNSDYNLGQIQLDLQILCGSSHVYTDMRRLTTGIRSEK